MAERTICRVCGEPYENSKDNCPRCGFYNVTRLAVGEKYILSMVQEYTNNYFPPGGQIVIYGYQYEEKSENPLPEPKVLEIMRFSLDEVHTKAPSIIWNREIKFAVLPSMNPMTITYRINGGELHEINLSMDSLTDYDREPLQIGIRMGDGLHFHLCLGTLTAHIETPPLRMME